MLDRELTQAEMKTLLGLATYPTYNNRELAEAIGLKPPTVTAICRRLHDKNMFRTVKMPLMGNLGWEIMSFTWADLNIFSKDQEVVNAAIKGSRGHPSFIWIVDGTKYSLISYARNYTMAQAHLHTLYEDKSLQNVLDGDLKYALFPLRLVTFKRFFE